MKNNNNSKVFADAIQHLKKSFHDDQASFNLTVIQF